MARIAMDITQSGPREGPTSSNGNSNVGPLSISSSNSFTARLQRLGSSGGSAAASAMQHMHPGRWLALVAFVVLSLLTYKYVQSGQLEHFVLVIQDDPYGTLHLFIVFHTLGVVLMFPAMLLQVLTGALYGLYVGTLVSWFATSVGQAIAFLVGRYIFRRPVKAYLVQRVPNFPQIEAAVRKEGWKLMCLLRLSPILPYNVLNYAAALTPISFMSYTLSSSAAIIPWTCLYTYLGTFSTSVVDLARGKVNYHAHHTAGGGMQFMSSMLYMCLLGITTVYGYILSKRAMTSLLKSVADQPESPQDIEGKGGPG